jgi:C4-dicarboxylate-specific signal transduction histidine kinase
MKRSLAVLAVGTCCAMALPATLLEPPAAQIAMAALAVLLLAALLALGFARPRPTQDPPPQSGLATPDLADPALAALAAGIVHEVAQPLSAARVSVEGLHYLRQLGRTPDPAQMARTLDRVGLSLLAMTQTLDHLRFLAGGESRPPLPLASGEAVRALVADRASWLRWSDVAIDVDDQGAHPVLADPAGLRLVLANLVRNAAEAVNDLPPERRRVRIRCDGTHIAVEDDGPGLPPAIAARLWQPFLSTRGEARGMGLSLARAAARRMGGDLRHEPHPGGGTRFVLDLQEAAP